MTPGAILFCLFIAYLVLEFLFGMVLGAALHKLFLGIRALFRSVTARNPKYLKPRNDDDAPSA